MKKFISTLAASVLAVSAIPTIAASAIEQNDMLSVSTEVLAESITVDETVIPAGSVAVTVEIENNSGFDSEMTKLEIGSSYNVIETSTDIPAFTVGNVLDDFRIVARDNENCLAFVYASANDCYDNGDMFTFYLEDNNIGDDYSISFCDEEYTASPTAVRYATIGDIDDDGHINAADASDVLRAIDRYLQFNPSDVNVEHFTVFALSLGLSRLLPYAPCAEVADTNINGLIKEEDADNIMEFYAWIATGHSYDVPPSPSNHCGEPVRYYC